MIEAVLWSSTLNASMNIFVYLGSKGEIYYGLRNKIFPQKKEVVFPIKTVH